jgi:hypothetical protein
MRHPERPAPLVNAEWGDPDQLRVLVCVLGMPSCRRSGDVFARTNFTRLISNSYV